MYIHRIIPDSVALNMSATFHKNNYGAIKIDDPVSEGFYDVQFTSLPYTLQE